MKQDIFDEQVLNPDTSSPDGETWDKQNKINVPSTKIEILTDDYLDIDFNLYTKNKSYSKKLGKFVAEQNN